MATEMRNTGIGVVGDTPWGTHFCCFYDTKQDLLDTLVPFFKAGLENHEFCLWALTEALTEQEATAALKEAIPALERYLADRSLELIPAREWYLKAGALDLERVTGAWDERLAKALARGYAGMRVSGDVGWLEAKDWDVFFEYEQVIGESIIGRPMTALCTYPLAKARAAEILDVVRAHQFAMGKRAGSWELVETAELKKAKKELEKLNAALEERVAERTQELTTLNEELRREIIDRKRAEAESAQLLENLETLSRRLVAVQESERAEIARELHDEVGQLLTGLRLMIEASGAADAPRREEMKRAVKELMGKVRDLSMGLRPPMLDPLGLLPALLWQIERFEGQTGIQVDFHHANLERRFSREIETTAFRVVQEALTNVARHAEVANARVEVWANPESLAVRVEDKGRGFLVEAATGGQSCGLAGMRERCRLLGGRLTIESAPEAGTRLSLELPSYPPPARRSEA